MNKYEEVIERLKYCANADVPDCERCGYFQCGCSLTALMMAAAEAIDSFVHPESSGLYDLEEVHENCTVQIWKNSITGEVSVGWYEDGAAEE